MIRSAWTAPVYTRPSRLKIGDRVRFNDYYFEHCNSISDKFPKEHWDRITFNKRNSIGCIDREYDEDTFWVQWGYAEYSQVAKKFLEAMPDGQ